MIYRFLYIFWRIFWKSMVVLFLTILMFSVAMFLILQTQPVKTYLSEVAEEWFNENYQGTIRIGKIGGILPYHIRVSDVSLVYEDHTVAAFESLSVRIDVIHLLRNHLTVNDIELKSPAVYLQTGSAEEYTLLEAFKPAQPAVKEEIVSFQPLQTIDIYAPFVRIENGALSVRNWREQHKLSQLPEPFHIENIRTEMFLEISTDQRYLDISYLTMNVEDWDARELILSGQIYNDSRFLEFNAIRMGLGDSYFDWDGEFIGINLFDNDVSRQFREASFLFNLQNSFLTPGELVLWFPGVSPELPELQLSFEAEGGQEKIKLDNAEGLAGNTVLHFDAVIEHFLKRDVLSYVMNVNEFRFSSNELEQIVPQSAELPFRDWSALTLGGALKGSADTVHVDLDVILPEGKLAAKGNINLFSPYATEMAITGKDINIAALEGFDQYPTRINAETFITGKQPSESGPRLNIRAALFDSHIGDFLVPDLHLEGQYAEERIRHKFTYFQEEHYLDGEGYIDFSSNIPHFVLSGRSSGLDLSTLFETIELPDSRWNIDYDINWHGQHPDDWYGRLVVDVFPSFVNGYELQPHQLYLDLNHPESKKRSLRITSSILDLLVEGHIGLSSPVTLYQHWKSYFYHRMEEELFFDAMDLLSNEVVDFEDFVKADMLLEFKDLELLKAYIPEFPNFRSEARLMLDVDASREELNINADWRDLSTYWNGIYIDGSKVSLNAGFRYDRPFAEQLDLDLDMQMDGILYHNYKLDSLLLVIHVEDNTFHSHSRIGNFGNNIRFVSWFEGRLTDTYIQTEVSELIIGTEQYLWHADGKPVIRFDEDRKLHIVDINLISGDDRIFVDGVFSESEEDSVQYRFLDVDLGRFSKMIDGRIDFEGVLNADLVTKYLTRTPVVHGRMDIDRLTFDGRVIGDVDFSSTYNPEDGRFDTRLHIFTDTTKYADYLEQNNGIGQYISAAGWFKTPELSEPDDFRYNFDVSAETIDLWVLTYLLDSIFESIEGQGTGKGTISGNLKEIDFSADFDVLRAVVEPVFFGTEYQLDGNVSVSRDEGVQVHELNARDGAGGTGIVTGTYEFNDFMPEKPMNLTLQMDNLRFLDNSGRPDVPFYGSVAGRGVVNISGSNISPFVRTVEPIHTTSRSRLSIPLEQQASIDDQRRLIRFVSDFGDIDRQQQIMEDPEILRSIDRTFMEVFRLDLQFVAAPNSTVQLIFDPLTGEIVNARGSGRVRIILEDENLQIFGNYEISDGNYLFVGGDIFTRRFRLREGGSIRWEGDPVNALLDITAVYRTRPNIAPLLGAATEQTNRIPVELLLEITGPLESIENDFFFEFPNAIDATQNAAVLNVLNSEEQKLIQATSLLFTGGFISGALIGETQTQELGSTLQARAGQVGLSQLLSSQINALLSDNLLNLDVDLNLFGFDQADLGIALRLFDDRLVLRREGEVGGEQTHIGDIGATYRINPNLSVEVFHRKDPMLMAILGTQAEVENVNGIGLEAQFRFNTWQEFRQGIWRNITSVFGLRRGNDTDRQNGE